MFKTDLEIAQEANMKKISDIASDLGIKEDDYEQYGKYKAKLSLDLLNSKNKDGKVILVTAINPTPAGEGKSTTTVGLTQALNKLGKKTMAALREPSFGPVLGLKGGAAGGGYSQVVPMEDINLHFTGDIHAITTANNAISALIDNHIYQGNELNIDEENILWKRCLDMNDRVLRSITVGQGSKFNGIERKDGFNITVASEIMAILCLASDANDLKNRIGQIVVAFNKDKKPVTVKDLGIEGAIAVILNDAIKPNLVQTLENTPVLIHGGPFANIAHGCNTIIATKMAMKLSDYVITEAGFGADLGAEKFFNIKSRIANIKPSAVVVVATIKALKMHGGVEKDNLKEEDVEALMSGVENLAKHIDTVNKFGLPYVIAINKFITDTEDEVKALTEWCEENNHPIELSEVWEHGGEGGISLANRVLEVMDNENNFNFLYDVKDSIESKMENISKNVYGAKGVIFTDKVKEQIKTFEKNGWDKLPICVAKTPASLSDNGKLLGRPTDFDITVKELRISKGAGFIVALTGKVMTMPGLPKKPAALNIDLVDGKIKGLF